MHTTEKLHFYLQKQMKCWHIDCISPLKKSFLTPFTVKKAFWAPVILWRPLVGSGPPCWEPVGYSFKQTRTMTGHLILGQTSSDRGTVLFFTYKIQTEIDNDIYKARQLTWKYCVKDLPLPIFLSFLHIWHINGQTWCVQIQRAVMQNK